MGIEYKVLANRLIDDRIELLGLNETILYLYELGYSFLSLVDEFHFDEEVIQEILEGREKE